MAKPTNACILLRRLAVLLLLLPQFVHAQSGQVLSFSEFRRLMVENTEPSLVIDNITLQYDRDKDADMLLKPADSALDKRDLVRGKIIWRNITVSDMVEEDRYIKDYFTEVDTILPFFKHLEFEHMLMIDTIQGWQLGFYNCAFEIGMEVREFNMDLMTFHHGQMNGHYVSKTAIQPFGHQRQVFTDCNFKNQMHFIGSQYIVNYIRCHFDPVPKEQPEVRELVQFAPNGTSNIYLGFHHCTFVNTDTHDVLRFNTVDFNDIWFDNNYFEPYVDLSYCNVNAFFADSNLFERGLIAEGLQIGQPSSYAEWYQFSNKLCLVSYKDDHLEIYKGITHEEIENRHWFHRLKSSKASFYDLYLFHENSNSADQCYVEMKKMDTRFYGYLYQQKPDMHNFFHWQMNRFLDRFSDYGTSPTKSIIYAGKVVIFFALFYFFLYHDWDISKLSLMKRLRLLTDYFREEKGIGRLYHEQNHEQIQSYEDFRHFMHGNKGEVPPYFIWLSEPLYRYALWRHKLNVGILSKTEILNGKWTSLASGKRQRTSVAVGLGIAGFLLFSVVLKAFNALVLSFNILMTLGFGDIPTRGIVKYLAIVEGLIGWVLLTIFSTSLVSQLLQ